MQIQVLRDQLSSQSREMSKIKQQAEDLEMLARTLTKSQESRN